LKFVPVHRDFDSTLGKPGEGPKKRKFVWDMQDSLLKEAIREAAVVQVQSRVEPVQASHLTLISAPLELKPKKPKGIRAAKWRAVVPDDAAQEVRGQVSVFERVGGLAGWGKSERQVLTRRQSRLDTIKLPSKGKFAQSVRAVRTDLVLSSRADETWLQYKAWVGCFLAWLRCYHVSSTPALQVYTELMEVLMDSLAVMCICYSMGTLEVYVGWSS
jgi:hypothetical protein